MVVALLNPEIHAQFRNNMRACKCDSSNYFAEQIIHEEVPLCSSTLERILTPLFRAYTFFRLGRPQEVTHDAVLVRYICSQCGRRFSVTYDFFVEGKVSECGEYTIKIRNRQTSNDVRSFRFIQTVFDRMKDTEYDWLDYNCKHWAYDFFAIITAKESVGLSAHFPNEAGDRHIS